MIKRGATKTNDASSLSFSFEDVAIILNMVIDLAEISLIHRRKKSMPTETWHRTSTRSSIAVKLTERNVNFYDVVEFADK